MNDTPRKRKTLEEQFWPKVQVTESCWLWTANKNKAAGGYGRLRVAGRMRQAHIISWEMHRGPVPDGMCVCHNCPGGDNPLCVNPDHLWLGTHQENMADRTAKGRGDKAVAAMHAVLEAHPEYRPRGEQHWSNRNPEMRVRGERHGHAKLTADSVCEIRSRYAAGGTSHRKLAREFGVSRRAITFVLSGETWKGVAA